MDEGDSESIASLRQFVQGVEREQAFARVAEHFGGLIYASAYRSTGNAALSEEIMQNVLTALARKAPSLLKHPSLAGWVFQTTRFETVNAKRKEKRRAEKHEAYQAEAEILLGSDGSWDEAMPLLDESMARLSGKDRDLVLRRFLRRRDSHRSRLRRAQRKRR